MKKFAFLAVLAMGVSLVACSPKSSDETPAEDGAQIPAAEKTLKDVTPSKALVDSVSYLVGINFGSFLKGYNFGDINYNELKKGILDFVNSKGSQRDPEFVEQFKINPEAMNDLFNRYLEMRQTYVGLENKEKSEKFLAANLKKEGVQATASGLQYKIIEAGNAENTPGPQDTVKVYYKGTLADGTVFDECPAEGGEPVSLVLNRVIKGWQEGIQLVGEGGKIQLWIPSELGYGEQGAQGIEPNSALVFDVEVVSVAKVVETEEAAE